MINRGFRGKAAIAIAVAGLLTLSACGDDGAGEVGESDKAGKDSATSSAASTASTSQNPELKKFEAKRSSTSASSTASEASGESDDSGSAVAHSLEALKSLEADSQLLAEVSDSIMNDSSVSQTTRDTATQLAALLTEQQPVVAEKLGDASGTGQSTVDADAVHRVLNDSGSHADLAYLTILEENLARISQSWGSIADSVSSDSASSDSGDAELAEQARGWSQRLSELDQQVKMRLTV